MANDFRIDVKIDPKTGAGRRKVEGDLDAIDRKSKSTRSTLERLVPVAALSAAFGKAANDALLFGDAMAEVSTLVDEATFDLSALEAAALDQAAAFGSNPVTQAQAQYQIISAGASSAAEATDILTTANKLAVGGVTDVATAADGLTSVMNAYGPAVANATDVSDTLFVGMRAGKTTIDQLSRSVGKVAPFAAQSGVAFDELVSSVAALTKGGISTTEAMTGVRAALAAVAKPTSEAGILAEDLGINFSAAGLKSQGFSAFLDDLVQKTGGSTEKLAQLFGGVEALVPVLALAGQAGQDFDLIMAQMANRAGETEEAFAKISESEGFKFRQSLAQLTVESIKLGNVLLTTIVPAMSFLTANIETVKAALVGLVAGYATYRAGLIIATLAQAAMSGQMAIMGGLVVSTASQVGVLAAAKVAAAGATGFLTGAIRGLTVAMLANPVTAIAVGIAALTSVIYSLVTATDEATRAAEEKAEADRIAAEQETLRAETMAQVVAMTTAERNATIESTKVARAKAIADREAALSAMQRARAAIEVARAELAQGGGDFGALANGYDALKRYNDEFERSGEEAMRLGRLLTEIENYNPPSQVVIPTVSTANGNGIASAAKAAEEARTTFADLEAQFERDIELSLLAGRAYDVRSAQLRAADQLGRELTDTEGDRIAQMVNEIKSNEDRIDSQDAYSATVARSIDDLLRDNALLRTNIDERGARAAVMAIEAQIGKRLTPIDAQRVKSLFAENEALSNQNRLYERLRGDLPDIIRDRQSLNALYAQGKISIEEYNRALFDLKIDEIDDRLARGDGSIADGFISELARMSEAARNWKGEVGGIFGDFVNDFSQGIGDSFGRAIVFSENLGQSIRDVAGNALSSMISALVQMGVQLLINKAITAALGTSATALAATQASALAAAWAPAAALASLATLGGNVGPALGGIALTVASTKALSAVGGIGFEEGGYTGDVGRKTPAGVVHGQEFVVNAQATRRNRSMLEAINRGASPGIAVQPSGGGNSLKLTIEDHVGARFETQRIGPDEVRVIAKQAAADVMDKSLGEGIAKEMGKPSSKGRKAMQDNFEVRPRR